MIRGHYVELVPHVHVVFAFSWTPDRHRPPLRSTALAGVTSCPSSPPPAAPTSRPERTIAPCRSQAHRRRPWPFPRPRARRTRRTDQADVRQPRGLREREHVHGPFPGRRSASSSPTDPVKRCSAMRAPGRSAHGAANGRLRHSPGQLTRRKAAPWIDQALAAAAALRPKRPRRNRQRSRRRQRSRSHEGRASRRSTSTGPLMRRRLHDDPAGPRLRLASSNSSPARRPGGPPVACGPDARAAPADAYVISYGLVATRGPGAARRRSGGSARFTGGRSRH